MVYPKIVKDLVSVPKGTPNRTLFVSVNKSWGKKITDPQTNRTVELEDCARGYWTEQNLVASRGCECEWLMATVNSCIVGVWKIDRKKGWMKPSDTPKVSHPSDKPIPPPKRKGCILIPVDMTVVQNFIGKVVHLGRNPNPLRGYFTEA